MKPVWKLLAISALVVSFAVASGSSAPAASYLRFTAIGAAGVCACCPQTCGGGTYFGCWSSVDHPDNAVTCIYQTPAGKHFNCLSCLNSAAAADTRSSSAELH